MPNVQYDPSVYTVLCTLGERVEGRPSLTYQSQQKRKVVKMVVVVLLVFVICCSPLQLLMGAAIFNTDTEVTTGNSIFI